MTFTRTDSIASSVLVIESDPLMLTAMGSVMNMQGHRTTLARTEEVAMQAILAGQFDVIILSIDDVDTGCAFAGRLRASASTGEVPVIFLVTQHTAADKQRLAGHGGVFSMLKPIDPYGLIELVEKALWMPHIAKARIGSPNVLQSRQSDWLRL
ncbi:MAG: response regulator [Pirellulaceae bacterium]